MVVNASELDGVPRGLDVYDVGKLSTWERQALQIARIPKAEFVSVLHTLPPEDQKEALRQRFRFDRAAFLLYCFPAIFYLPFNAYHLESLAEPKVHWTARVPKVIRRATAAPRGIAKTTLSKGECVHDVVYGLEGYEIVMSADLRGARKITKHIRSIFLSSRSPLAKLYGPFIVAGGVQEFTVQCRGSRPIGFLARSFGTQMRGAEEEAQRPTKIIVDDGERPDRVRNSNLRKDDWAFLVEDVLKAGPKEGGLFVDWRGTVLHPDAILPNLLKNPGWFSKLWKSILEWPTNQGLWAECGRIWADLTRGEDRFDAAESFYDEHREAMDEGVSVLDPVAEPIFKLYEQIWGEGLTSFLKEKQNEPRQPGTSYFDSHTFARCRIVQDEQRGECVLTADGKRLIPFHELRISMRLDPIPGDELGTIGEGTGAGGGDFACICVIGRDKYGYGFVLDVWLKRARDSEQIAAMWALAERWGAQNATIESNGFQRLITRAFKRQQAERRAAKRFWQIRVVNDNSTTNKNDRIARLEPVTHNGWLQFCEHLRPEVFAQFDDFPTGAHDDAPDAIEGAWRKSGSAPSGVSKQPLTGVY